MSEPTYRVEVESRPRETGGTLWTCDIYRVADDEYLESAVGRSREEAVGGAQSMVRGWSQVQSETVYLTEDGEPHEAVRVLDPHEVQR